MTSLRLGEVFRRTASGLPHPVERIETARPSFERNGLHSMVDPEGDGHMYLESGHWLMPTLHGEKPDWTLHIGHESDPLLDRKMTVDLGPGDEDVGDRIVRHLRRPDVLRAMREQMQGPYGDE